MAYFTEDYNNFFKGLAANNHRDWFHDNKKLYERAVKAPFAAFLKDLIARIQQEFDPELILEPKDAIFRINRDIRFSKDKTPYKLNRSAAICRGGRKQMNRPGLYLQFGVGEFMLGGGMYQPDKVRLQQIREAIVQQPEVVRALQADATFQQFYGSIKGDKNKRLPAEFKATHAELPIIANKQFYFMANYEDQEELLMREDLMDWVLEHYAVGQGWNQFLVEATEQADAA